MSPVEDPFDDLMKLWDKTSDEHITWQKTRHVHSMDEMFVTLKKLLVQEQEIEKYDEIIKPLPPMDKAPSLAAKYKNLYQIQSFLSDVLLELFSRVISEMKKEKKPVRDFLDPRIKSMIAEQVRIEVAKKLQKPKVKHDTKRKKKSL